MLRFSSCKNKFYTSKVEKNDQECQVGHAKMCMRKVRILRNLTFLKILSAIFYKSKVSKKEQAMRGINGQELREVVPFDV